MNIILIFFLIFIGLTLFSVAWTSVSFAPFVPSRTKDLKRIFKLAGLKKGELFYDLGCGTGKLVVYAAKNYQARAVGIELAWMVWLVAKARQFFNRNKDLKIKFGNLFKEDLSNADVVYFFGMPDTIKLRLKEKLERELKVGARVVSYTFSVPGWEEEAVDKPSRKEASVYLYKR